MSKQRTSLNILSLGVLLSIGLLAGLVAADEPEKVAMVGKNLSAFRAPRGDWMIVGEASMDPAKRKRLVTKPGEAVAVNGPTGRTRNLIGKLEHGDVEAHIEFMVPEGSNSGVYFQGRYEVQILDSWGVKKLAYGDCGGIYARYDSKSGKTFDGQPPRVNASRPPGQWQTFDVLFRAPRFDAAGKKIANARFVKVVHNGIVVHQDVELTGPTRAATFRDEKPRGPLMLQGDHGPVAYRNLWLRPLSGK